MKKIVITALLALGLVNALSAQAAKAQSGFYVNGQAGWSVVDAPTFWPAIPYSILSSSLYNETPENYVFGASIGFDVALNQSFMLGLEAGHVDLGMTDYSYNLPGILSGTGDIRSNGNQVLFTGTYMDPSGWTVFGKVGAIRQETKSTFGDTVSDSQDIIETIPAVAFGAGYWVSPYLGFTLQYEHTFGQDWNFQSWAGQPVTEPMSQNIFSAGVTGKLPL